MSTQQMRKRVAQLEEKRNPKYDGTITWEDFLEFRDLQRDPQRLQEMVSRPAGAKYRALLAALERSAAERTDRQ
jgi:hypothetical protein